MSAADIDIRVTGKAGRITLQRPDALNALTYDMCTATEQALDAWQDDAAVNLVVIDATGDRAFCAGGDIADLYATGTAGDYAFGQKFWADEYRLNKKIFDYPKPIVSFMQGFTMGGGVGLGCHGTHRVVGESSQIAMPECGIGLVPDVGGSLMLALAPGRVGEYLGTTGARMNADDAIFAGFADLKIPEDRWADLTGQLETTGDPQVLEAGAIAPTTGPIAAQQAEIDTHFGGERLVDILRSLEHADSDFATATMKLLSRNSPLSMACAVEILHRLRGPSITLEKVLEHEYRFTARAMEHGDFLEGIRAAIVDKDRKPKWQFADMKVPDLAVSNMLLPLGDMTLDLGEPT